MQMWHNLFLFTIVVMPMHALVSMLVTVVVVCVTMGFVSSDVQTMLATRVKTIVHYYQACRCAVMY